MRVGARVRQVIARYGFVLAVLVAITGVVLLANAALTYTNPPSTTESYTTAEREFATGVETSAVVVNNSSLYTEGRTLTNMPVYFYTATPNLTYHVRTSVPEETRTTVSVRLVLQLSATRNGDEFWEYTRVFLAEQTTTTGDAVWTNATVNMTAVRGLIAEKRAAIGEIGTFSSIQRLNVTYSSNEYSGTLSATAPLVTTGRAYWTDADLSTNRVHRESATRTVTQEPNTGLAVLFLIAGLGLLGLAGSVYVRSREYDLRSIQEEIERDRYSEWISNGEIPTKSEKEYIRVDSIEDVVDIAIDSNKRVIFDDDLDVYAVVEGDLVYFYTTDTQGVTDWLDV